MSEIARRKITNIQVLRAVAALLVFCAHLVGAERDYGGGGAVLPGFLEMGVTGVDLFFLISGFVMVYVTWPFALKQDPANKPTASRFLLRRIVRIYPLYWILTIVLLALYAGKKLLFGEDTPIPNLIESFLLIPSDQFPIIPVGWTLVHEMYFYLVFAALLLFPHRFLPWLLGLWGIIVGASYGLGWQTNNAWTFVVFSPLTFEFLLGCAIAWITLNGTTQSGKIVLAISGLWLFCLLVPLAAWLYPQAVTDHGVRALIFTLPFGLLLYAAVSLEWRDHLSGPAWLVGLGDASYALYLIHIPVFLVVGKVMSNFAGPGLIDNFILIAVFIVSGIGAALVTHRYIEKPIIDIMRKLLR